MGLFDNNTEKIIDGLQKPEWEIKSPTIQSDEGWEKKFDKEWTEAEDYDENSDGELFYSVNKESIKQFIKSTLKEQRDELAFEIEKWDRTELDNASKYLKIKAYIISLINKK